MSWLLWREYRLNRLILTVGFMGLLLPCMIVFLNSIGGSDDHETAWVLVILLSELTVAMLAGNAIAGERADCSAEFVAYLPLRRPRLVASKLLLFMITITAMWSVSALIAPADCPGVFPFPTSFFVIYGVGWCLSSIQSSTVFASVMGWCAHIVVLVSSLVFFLTTMKLEEHTVSNMEENLVDYVFEPTLDLYNTIGLTVAVVSFSIGTWAYLRRSAP